MEVLVEIAVWLLQILAELLLQAVFELLFELGLHAVREPFRFPKRNPLIAAIGYLIIGATAGALSLLLYPTLFVASLAGQIANLIVTPAILGFVMAGVGAWRRKRDEALFRIDKFAYGYVFAFAMALSRFLLSHAW